MVFSGPPAWGEMLEHRSVPVCQKPWIELVAVVGDGRRNGARCQDSHLLAAPGANAVGTARRNRARRGANAGALRPAASTVPRLDWSALLVVHCNRSSGSVRLLARSGPMSVHGSRSRTAIGYGGARRPRPDRGVSDVYLRHSAIRKDGKTHVYWRLASCCCAVIRADETGLES